ncbi:MAG: pantetheine-phosphate adenylyltransferase [Clostridia bacterium]|nr:pantetheine-phosphate adenylyltransferase [Clostridia bacterium]
MKIALYPGSFDPVTYGHLDVIRRASKLFDKLVVGVSNNPKKTPSFTLDERQDMIRRVVAAEGITNVEIGSYTSLLVDYAAQVGANVIVRGLRAVSDFEYEFQMSLANHQLHPDIETIFFNTQERNLYISSSLVKEIASHNGDITRFVPPGIVEDIQNRFKTL